MATTRRRKQGLPRIKPLPGTKPLPGFKPMRIKPLKDLPGLPDLPGPRSAPPTVAADPTVLQAIERALLDQRTITALYSERRRELAPLILGTRNGEHRLWAYQFGGESDHRCKCFVVGKLSDVEALDGSWQEPETNPGHDACIDTVLQRVVSW